VEPALPAGLSIQSPTGKISGMLEAPTPMTTYSVLAENTGGCAACALEMEVKLPQPLKLLYTSVKREYLYMQQLREVPELLLEKSTSDAFDLAGAGVARPSVGGIFKARARHALRQKAVAAAGVKFSIEPDLPEGMYMSPVTGAISGLPTRKTDITAYTVTAENKVGRATRVVEFCVRQIAPENLGFPLVEKVYYTGEPVALVPAVTGLVEEWTVEPHLPSGLMLDQVTGQIGGLPSEVTEDTTYLVKARNEEGEAQTSITFAIARAPPTDLSYPEARAVYAKLRRIEVFPTVKGEVNEFRIAPELPTGLTFDPQTGIIYGIPTAVAPETLYKITADNETGSTATTVTLAVQVMPPDNLSYPRLDDLYTVGEPVLLEPSIEGGAEEWAIEPALPSGMNFDVSTGIISGSPTSTCPRQSYTVSALNEAGATSTTLTFSVTAPAPVDFCYHGVQSEYNWKTQCEIQPDVSKCICCTFRLLRKSPALPSGLQLDANTGVISGVPDAETEMKTYMVAAKSAGGECVTELSFAIANLTPSLPDPRFLDLLEDCSTIAEVLELEPDKSRAMGSWMTWMVHRAWMNDEILVDFNFSGLEMPPPHVVWHVAPKLMEAMATNTHIKVLILSQSNMQKPSGLQMAEALQTNTALEHLNIESNNLDQESIRAMVQALAVNNKTSIHTFRCQHQLGISSQFFGRPFEEALCDLMRTNTTLCRIGCDIRDANCLNVVTRATMRNIDLERRRRKGGGASSEVAAEVKPVLKGVKLEEAPYDKQAFEVFAHADEGMRANLTEARGAFVELGRVPTQQQFQAHLSQRCKSLNYKEAKEVVDAARMMALRGAIGTEITITDIYSTESKGTLRGVTQNNTNWALNVEVDGTKRYSYTSTQDPEIKVSASFGGWMVRAS
jgi:hypothetical protein